MTETEKIIWGTIAGLISSLVLATIIWFAKKRSDQISLKGSLVATADINILNTIGCAGLILTVMCKSKRVAKIKESYISLITDKEMIESFDKAFSFSFGPGYNPALPAPKLIVGLIPLSKPSNYGAYILERDDVCKFMLPIERLLDLLIEAPSENVSLCVKDLNGDEFVLMKGFELQKHIHTLNEIHGNIPRNLKVPLSIRLVTSTTSPSDASGMIGKTNPNPLDFKSRSDGD